MMGMIMAGMVVTGSERQGRPKAVQPGNREWITLIQAINAEGQSIAPFIIGAGQYHLANWYRECNLPGDWVIAMSPNGWTNNQLGLEWLKHFNRSTTKRLNSRYRLLILDGHESHHSTDFEKYCKANKITTLCMPAHASHLLQPLDVGCFAVLNKAYGREIEHLIRCSITHISKTEFLPAFYAAFQTTFIESNIRGGGGSAGNGSQKRRYLPLLHQSTHRNGNGNHDRPFYYCQSGHNRVFAHNSECWCKRAC
jgi:hypothetical protein